MKRMAAVFCLVVLTVAVLFGCGPKYSEETILHEEGSEFLPVGYAGSWEELKQSAMVVDWEVAVPNKEAAMEIASGYYRILHEQKGLFGDKQVPVYTYHNTKETFWVVCFGDKNLLKTGPDQCIVIDEETGAFLTAWIA